MKKILLSIVAVFATISAFANTYSYEFTQKTIDGNATFALGAVNWISENEGGYYGYDATKGQQIGSGSKPAATWTLSTTGFSGTITSIKVTTSGASQVAGTLDVTVGGEAFGEQYTLTSTSTQVEFKGSASGEVVLSWAQTSSKALYLKAIEVTYTSAAGSVDAPVLSPNGGTFYTPQTLRITAGENAAIYYSTGGEYTKYVSAITISSSCTVSAYAELDGKKSDTVTQTYVIADQYNSFEDLMKVDANNQPVAVYVNDLKIESIYTTSKGNRNGLYFNINGEKTEMYDYDVPNDWEAGGTVSGIMYGIWKNYNGMKEIDATGTDFDYATNLEYTAPAGAIAKPTITPASGTFAEVQTVTITAPEGCGIVYTTDGSQPIYGSQTAKCVESNSTSFQVTETTTIKAIAYDLNDEDICSGVVSATITISAPVSTEPIALSELTNTSFEAWTAGNPDQWKASTSASSATLTQVETAHTGSYGVKIGGSSSNKRLASTEVSIPAGIYTMTLWAYGEGGKSNVRPGYVKVVINEEGTGYKIADSSKDYVYVASQEAAPDGQWTEVKHTFAIESDIIASILVMNPKNCGDVIVDDIEFRIATDEEKQAYEIATSISKINAISNADGKFVENGKLVIVKNGKKFNALGISM